MSNAKQIDNGFKLLAIIPLNGCESRFRKNLEVGQIFSFYQDYSIQLNEGFDRVKAVKRKDDIEHQHIYNLKNGINLNISAVVGQNGSGKSAIFELLYYLIFLYSTQKKLANKRTILSEIDPDLKFRLGELKDSIQRFSKILGEDKKNELKLREELIEINGLFKINLDSIINIKTGEIQFNLFLLELLQLEKKIEKKIDEENSILSSIKIGLAISMLFEKNSKIYEFHYSFSSSFLLINHTDHVEIEFDNFGLEDLFYTISLNYSHHSLNSKTLGKWINRLFHKNDAYMSPVVINPMRNEGVFNINKEISLAKERLMMNLVYEIFILKKNVLLEKYKVTKFIFTLKKIPPILDLSFSNLDEDELKRIQNYIGPITVETKNIDNYKPYAVGYIKHKINKIMMQYAPLFVKSDVGVNARQNYTKSMHDWLQIILHADDSHITKKVKQALNFHKFYSDDLWKFNSSQDVILTIEQMNSWLEKCNEKYDLLDPIELNKIAHPSIFNVDFELISDNEEILKLSELSSGEQQLIFNTNTILYHVYNLQSAHFKSIEEEKVTLERIRYKNINIVLDEIELYYHPEFQRKIVNEIIINLDRVKKIDEGGIESINICFLTHSPFILSDIPSSNILRLKNGKKVNVDGETFGANIHELLHDSFFMDSTLGAYAKSKIDEILKFYYEVRQGVDLKSEFEAKKDLFRFVIENIGEDVIRGVLQNHYQYIEETLNPKRETYEKN